MPTSSSAFFNACIAPPTMTERESDWRSCSESSTVMAAVSGPRPRSIRAPLLPSLLPKEHLMNEQHVEILLVEDNPNDEMLALHAFKKHNLANKVHVVRDGAEALEFIFCTGAYAERHFENPRVVLLD